MIIFDLDGTLADCEHRRHYVNPYKNPDYYQSIHREGRLSKMFFLHKESKKRWKPNWKAFYEACDQDKRIIPTLETFLSLNYDPHTRRVEIWSGRCESVREKTVKWLMDALPEYEGCQYINRILKMRPIGDNTPDDQLKEKWLHETYEDTKWGSRTPVEYVFDDRPKVIRMWQSHGIFVFNCCQHDKEF